ncbi:hypothetical protein [Curtobacterium flaccumfaciens]|uniref:hypothetical protein n=1 Tax=Curtobacterium flaccumfaciens TaxID=2035 RepID=UPI001BDF0AD5|nr:hypothetical protein [Curtobacterium flaccumfaciens]MBT1607254.1 hypothetical protein [Curtobacterium flaccumfaciens pv. betae]MBT1656773.1 hypothetical protein [Curtobacterium flaccumfaciens pv. betae]MCS0472533.1 hypothetical protein [Curtobacterium flaccumfaciens pv. betae]MCS0476111.1 hypothetical protein [Curtobacterium flaccumfaciens pv. betae]MCS0479273.1 hypothetical protein [Curtobacterium flaccumfaciens pv. betae]
MQLTPQLRSVSPTRTRMVAAAVVAVAALTLAISGPASAAMAAQSTPAEKVALSLEHGTIAQDVKTGRISEADIVAAAAAGFTVNGRHIASWTNLSPAQEAQAEQGAEQMAADPAMSAARTAQPQTVQLHAGGPTVTTPHTTAGTHPGGIDDDKHWWNHIFEDHILYVNGKWLSWMISVPLVYALASACTFYDLSKASCALLGVVIAGGAAAGLQSWSCIKNGIWIDVPYIWRTHC